MDYSKGEHVVYGSNGVCLIEDISSRSYPGDGAERTYYTLRPLNSPSSTLYVPADNEQLCARIRRVLTPEQVESIVAGTKGDKMNGTTTASSGSPASAILLTAAISAV